MKYYQMSEQDLYEILIDLENCLFINLERLEVKEDGGPDDDEEPEIDLIISRAKKKHVRGNFTL